MVYRITNENLLKFGNHIIGQLDPDNEYDRSLYEHAKKLFRDGMVYNIKQYDSLIISKVSDNKEKLDISLDLVNPSKSNCSCFNVNNCEHILATLFSCYSISGTIGELYALWWNKQESSKQRKTQVNKKSSSAQIKKSTKKLPLSATTPFSQKYMAKFKNFIEVKDIPEIKDFQYLHAELRTYQKKGVEWLIHLKKYRFGSLLADDMGLGKTLQTIAYFVHLKENNKLPRASLIVAPTSVISTWLHEISRFAPYLGVYVHYGSDRYKDDKFQYAVNNTDLVITSYALSVIDKEMLSNFEWETICIDEAQNIKNANTKQSKAIRSFKANHKIALTGTPIENHLSELWAIYDFLNPGFLGTLTMFKKLFAVPILKGDKDKTTQLKYMIQPFLLRRTKQDKEIALNLPDKQEQKEYCFLTEEQNALYKQVVSETMGKLDTLSGLERRGFIFTMLNKLKQICNHPALYLKEEKPRDIVIRSQKIELLLSIVESVIEQKESCLIFTQYIQMGNLIKEVIENETGEKVLFLNGSVPKEKRDEMIDLFRAGEVKVLTLSLKAGGTGLNLTEANHVIHFDRWWNPAVENQATDRVYRIGQQRFVHIHKLIVTGTLEEKIDEMIIKKQELTDTFVTNDKYISELTTDEIRELLGDLN